VELSFKTLHRGRITGNLDHAPVAERPIALPPVSEEVAMPDLGGLARYCPLRELGGD
jgi:hypothetical protein